MVSIGNVQGPLVVDLISGCQTVNTYYHCRWVDTLVGVWHENTHLAICIFVDVGYRTRYTLDEKEVDFTRYEL